MAVLLLLLVPIFFGILLFIRQRDENISSRLTLLSSTLVLGISILTVSPWGQPESLFFTAPWLSMLGSSFTLRMDGMGALLTLLNACAYFLLMLYLLNRKIERPASFYGWLLLAQAGMMGVFLASDALLFYFFWELALIPMYFLASQWGGVRRIQVTFTFFIYTFVGSVLMLIGILYLQAKTPDHSFAWESFLRLKLSTNQQSWLFWLFFIAFAVKMPLFPFHTWQPDTYEEAPTPVTAILSAIMVKMGVFGLLRWVLPVFPLAAYQWGDVVMTLGVISILYASLLAWKQNDLKRLVAYSSMAHLGLMTVAAFSVNEIGYQGLLIQLFSHGVNILGLWLLLDLVERKFGTRKMDELGGIAQQSPLFAIFFVVIALANIALPLTNGFIGEFLMFNGILSAKTNYFWVFTLLAGTGIIFSAIYTLNMIRLIIFGAVKEKTQQTFILSGSEKITLGIIVLLIFIFGVYPQPLLDLTASYAGQLFNSTDISSLFRKS